MAIKKIGIGTDWATYDELKSNNVVAQGWIEYGDMCCLKENKDFQDIGSKLLEERGEQSFTNFLKNMFHEIKSGDIILAYEGNSLKGIAEIPPRFQYEFNTNLENYRNTLYPVLWIDWRDFCDTDEYDWQGGQGVPGIQNCNTPVARYIESHWKQFKEKQGLNVQPESCQEHLVELENSYDSRCQASHVTLKKYFSDKRKKMEIKKYIELLESNYNLVLNGAPGTGKTHLAWDIVNNMNAVSGFVQFHPSYDYTDFVKGLRPVSQDNGVIGFERKDGVFKAFCKKAIANPTTKHVFVIDEINRGELSKIFGELFFCIDPGYRGDNHHVSTQYQNLIADDDVFKDGFYIPENVYIIGTMNDIDRSVESMDFAMRRRFAWSEVKADENVSMLEALGSLKDKAERKMACLNKAIEETEGLNSSYQIGAAYFLKLKNYDKEGMNPFKKLWNNHIRGLLVEYLRGMEDSEEILNKLKEEYEK